MIAERAQPAAPGEKPHARQAPAGDEQREQAMPKATTTSSGARSIELVVTVAEIESGSIAIASIIPSETIERATAPRPTRMPPSLRSTPTLIR